jgi:hypothetical protein
MGQVPDWEIMRLAFFLGFCGFGVQDGFHIGNRGGDDGCGVIFSFSFMRKDLAK